MLGQPNYGSRKGDRFCNVYKVGLWGFKNANQSVVKTNKLKRALGLFISVFCVGQLCSCLAQNMPIDYQPEQPGQTNIQTTGKTCDIISNFIIPRCSGCHRADGQFPDLSFDSIPLLTTTNSESFSGVPILIPGDPDGSLLYRKVAGTQSALEGTRMPPQGPAPDTVISDLRTWIEEGAETDCGTATTAPPERYHPENWAEAENHGQAMKHQEQDCRSCHGDTLEGQVGPSCDTCHQAGWRTNCTYCHGGIETMNGAPPRDIDGSLDPLLNSFKVHTQHVSNNNHPAYACSQCHLEPDNVLSIGHAFDQTPKVAEVDFSNGLSNGGRYEGNGRCSNIYCHGNGLDRGDYTHDDAQPNCNGCHPSQSSPRIEWRQMSGAHRDHLREDLQCADCHQMTVNTDGDRIIDANLHVNGQVDFEFSNNEMNRGNDGRCAGSCHNEAHDRADWFD